MPIKQIDPKAAWEMIQKDPKAILIDVRTVEEFTDGHPERALNIPIFTLDARSGQKLPNMDFAGVIAKHVPKNASVYLSCRSGQRSMMAAMQMQALGYESLFNVKGGFGGSEDTPGWQACGLPCSAANGPDISYEGLKQ